VAISGLKRPAGLRKWWVVVVVGRMKNLHYTRRRPLQTREDEEEEDEDENANAIIIKNGLLMRKRRRRWGQPRLPPRIRSRFSPPIYKSRQVKRKENKKRKKKKHARAGGGVQLGPFLLLFPSPSTQLDILENTQAKRLGTLSSVDFLLVRVHAVAHSRNFPPPHPTQNIPVLIFF
jgi:hypothetical protein